MDRPPLIAGADGCRGGWVVVTARSSAGGARCDRLAAIVVESLDDHIEMARTGRLAALAVDMPIGLLDHHPRRADVEARRVVGPRRSSVFPTPVRAVLDATDYTDACDRSRAASGVAPSKQAWNLMPKIRRLDALIEPSDQQAVVEAHPECAFVRLNDGRPLPHAKSSHDGRILRRRLLEDAGWFDRDELEVLLRPGSTVAPPVDLIDALALLGTARHLVMGTARRLGVEPRPETDRRGRRAEIVW